MTGELAFAGAVPVLCPTSFTGLAVDSRHPARQTGAPTAQLKLPKLPSFPKLPKLPSLPKKGDGKAAAPGRTVAETIKVTAASSSDQSAPSFQPSARASIVASGVSSAVKFYNPKTARAVYSADAKGHGATAFDSRVSGPDAGTNARANKNSTFRNMDPFTSDPVWARPDWSPADADVATRAVFRNVLGNAYIMEEEVAGLATEISCYKKTGITKEFVRAIALSDAYKSRYFEPMSNTRFVELNYLHFLGRAPRTQEEISEHIQILINEGYNSEINSYMDCDEYDTLWGDQRVPQPNFRGGHDYNQGMNTLACLSGGFSRSDRVNSAAFFAAGSYMNASPLSIGKGLPEAWRGENAARDAAGPLREFPVSFWNPERDDMANAGGIDWKARMGVNSRNWYADSASFKEVMKPVLKHSPKEEEEAAAVLKYGSTMGKNYVGKRYEWSMAPFLDFKPPSSADAMNGSINLEMKEISFSIPSNLSQSV